LGWGGLGFWPGFGFGLGSGLGFGLGYGLFGLGYGLGGFGYGGWGYGGYGGYGYGDYWPGYGLGYGGLGFGLGLGYGGLGYGYDGYGYGGYGYDPYYGGYGLSSWTYGPSLYDWGYSSYSNPYWSGLYGTTSPSAALVPSVAYDYSQPISTLAAPPDPGVTSQAITCFDAAREAFKAGNYTRALELTDQAIRQMPNDAALHEFRALVLFAFQRYDESAAALYAVLTAGPGWDWATLSGLYPSVSVYTQQLRALEAYCGQHPTSAPARFVLAYHYLTEGHSLAALQQLKEVAALQPQDGLSPQLARQLEPTAAAAPAGSATGPGATGSTGSLPAAPPPLQETTAALPPASSLPASPAPSSPGREGHLEGTWNAQPDKDTTISVTLPDPGHFTWTVTQQGQPRQLQGKLTYGNGILTLAQDQGPAIVGNLTWTDENHFTFKVPGAGPNDPGLTFTRQ
jgi:tetratricopeptide (TPR) repeat protein